MADAKTIMHGDRDESAVIRLAPGAGFTTDGATCDACAQRIEPGAPCALHSFREPPPPRPLDFPQDQWDAMWRAAPNPPFHALYHPWCEPGRTHVWSEDGYEGSYETPEPR